MSFTPRGVGGGTESARGRVLQEEGRNMNREEVLSQLTAHRAEFLGFLRSRGDSAETAEDLLQDALIRAMDRAGDLEHPEALLGWFYRVLENASRDHHRRRMVASRSVEQLSRETTGDSVVPNDAPSRTCQCVHKLKAELKPEYAQALDRIEVDDVAVKDFAAEEGISRSNAAVRVFRARESLRQKVQAKCGHCAAAGCVDCSCAS